MNNGSGSWFALRKFKVEINVNQLQLIALYAILQSLLFLPVDFFKKCFKGHISRIYIHM